MDDREDFCLTLPVEVGVIVRGFQVWDEDVETMWHISKVFQETSPNYKVCNMIYPVGTKEDCAVVQFSYGTGVQELINIGTLKIEGKTELRIEEIKTFAFGKTSFIRIDRVVACLLPNLASIDCENGVEYVDKDEDHCFVSQSKEALQKTINSIIVEMRKSLGRERSRSSDSESHSDSESGCESFVMVNKEEVKDVIACSVVISRIVSKIHDWKDEVSKFLQNLECENATIVYTAEDHAIALFSDEKGADWFLAKASQITKSPVRCNRLTVPRVMDGREYIRVQPVVYALVPDIVNRVKQRWKASVIILNDDKFIIQDNKQQILTKLTRHVSKKVLKNYSSCPDSTSQVSDRESMKIPTKPDDDSGTNLSDSDRKQSFNVRKDEIPISMSVKEVSEEPESHMDEQCTQHRDNEMDKTSNHYEPLQAKSCNGQGKKRKNTVTEEKAQVQEKDTNENGSENLSGEIGIVKRPKIVGAKKYPDKCSIASENQPFVQCFTTQEEHAKDMRQENDTFCHISKSKENVGTNKCGQCDREDLNQVDVHDDQTSQCKIVEVEKQKCSHREETKAKKQNDVWDHDIRQSGIDKKENKMDDEEKIKKGQSDRENMNGKGKVNFDDQQASQGKVDKGEKQQHSHREETKAKKQSDVQDCDMRQCGIDKKEDNTVEETTRKVKGSQSDSPEMNDSEVHVDDRQTSQSKIEKREHSLREDTKDKIKQDACDQDIRQSEIDKEKDQNKSNAQNTGKTMEGDSKDIQDYQIGHNIDNEGGGKQENCFREENRINKQKDSEDDQTHSPCEINKEEKKKYDQCQHAGQQLNQIKIDEQGRQEEKQWDAQELLTEQKEDTNGKMKDDHTKQSQLPERHHQVLHEYQKENIKTSDQSNVHGRSICDKMIVDEKQEYDDQAQTAGQKGDTNGKSQRNDPCADVKRTKLGDCQGLLTEQKEDTKCKMKVITQTDQYINQSQPPEKLYEEHGQVLHANQREYKKITGQSNVHDANADDKKGEVQEDGQGLCTDQKESTNGRMKEHAQDDQLNQSHIAKDEKGGHDPVLNDTKNTKGKDQGNIPAYTRQDKRQAQQPSQKEGRNYSVQMTAQDQHNIQETIDDKKKQGGGHKTGHEYSGKGQNVIQGHKMQQNGGRNQNGESTVELTAGKKVEVKKQSQEDPRKDYFTVHNEVYQFLIEFHGKKIREIEKDYRVTIKWFKNETERNLAVLSKVDKDEEGRIFAENEFIHLYQKVSNSVKLQEVSVVNYNSSKIKKSVKQTMQESQNVLLLHKNKHVLFIGEENNVTLAKKIFKKLLGIPVEEKRLKKSDQGPEASSDSSSEIIVGGKIKVIIKRGDITTENVDVIVNAANGKLAHGGGVAKAIASKAGRRIDDEGQKKLRERGSSLRVSEVLHTGGYNLKAKHVIHAVGPSGKSQFQYLLKKTFLNCLAYADVDLKAATVAMPLISSGNFGGGKRECAEALANSVFDFAQQTVLNLKEIRLVNIDAEATQEIQTQINAIRDIPKSQCSAVAENNDSGCEMVLPTHSSIAEINLSHAVLVEGFEIYKSLQKTKLNLVMFLPKYTNGGGEVEHVIYPVEIFPRNAVLIFKEQKVAEFLISLGESTTKSGKTLLFKSIEVGHHWEAIILDISLIYSSKLLNRIPARCEDLGDGQLLLKSQESAHEVITYINNELEKWLKTQVDRTDVDSSAYGDTKGKFSESQCVVVRGFKMHESQEQTRDKLEIILTKGKNGGGDVVQIVYPFENSTTKALVIFYDTEVARSLIEAKKMSDGKGLSLEISPFKKRTLETSHCVIVRGFKKYESQERTEDALQIILQKRNMGGGDVDMVIYPFGKSTNTAVAIFSQTEVANSLIKAQTISDGKAQNLKIYPFEIMSCHQKKTFILELGEAVVQLKPNLKDEIFSAIDVKGKFLKDERKLMLVEEDDIHKVYEDVSDGIKGLLSSYIIDVTDEDSAESQKIDRPDFLVCQFFKNCHMDKVKEIERIHDVTIKWMPDKNELTVQSNKPGDDRDRKIAEERFRDLYQKIHPMIKRLQVEDVHLVDAQKAENKITRKHADVLILPKEYVFIGREDNVKIAMKDFKMLCETTTFERSVKDLLLEDVEYTIGRLKVIIRHGDITNEDVDVIVNAANGELQHGSGVARAIAMKAGRFIHDEGQRLLKQRRRALNVSEVLHTNGYNLKAQYVLHAVGPRHGRDHPFQSLLEKTFLTCLEHADGILEARSIAIPLISSGAFGGNKEECAKLLCESICQSVQSEKCQNLKKICLVNIDVEATTAIQDIFKKYCENLGQSCQATNVHPLQTRLATSTLPRDETCSHNLYSTQPVKNESIYFNQTSVPQNTHSKGQMSKVRDTSKFKESSYGEQNNRNIMQEQRSKSTLPPTASTNAASTHTAGSVTMDEEEKCPICFDKLTETKKQLSCGHKFCTNCIEKALNMKPVCPICGKVFGALTGNQPRGFMNTVYSSRFSLPGYQGCGHIEITYTIPSGTQTHEHPHPGKLYHGTQRIAYLPDNRDGRYVASLLRKAFDARLIFTIGTSITTGASDRVTWNDIHHKTNVSGGPNNYGYPDPNYLRRVREELAAKGIK